MPDVSPAATPGLDHGRRVRQRPRTISGTGLPRAIVRGAAVLLAVAVLSAATPASASRAVAIGNSSTTGVKATTLSTISTLAAVFPPAGDPADAQRMPHTNQPKAPTAESPSAASSTAAQRRMPLLMGYWARWGADSRPLDDLKQHADALDWFSPYWYTLTADGRLRSRESGHAALVRLAHSHHQRVVVLVNIQTAAKEKLADAGFRKKAAAAIGRMLKAEQADGVNIDFEGLPASLRAALTAFVSTVKRTLGPHRLTTVAVGPKTTADPAANPMGAVYSYRDLGRVADAVVIMTYDQHSSAGKPGPVASYDWVARVAAYAARTMPPKKVILGLAGYGYDWPSAEWRSGGGRTIGARELPALLDRTGASIDVDPASRETVLHYRGAQGTPHTIWVERAGDAALRASLARKLGLGGVALWSIGDESDAFWPKVQQALGR